MATINAAFIGLGAMGFPMAGHLTSRGHRVTVFNRTEKKAAEWVAKYGGNRAPTPADAAREADFVFICVGNDQDLYSVTLDEKSGVLPVMRAGAVLVDHTTASAAAARRLDAAARESGVAFLDAPVSGGQAGAENGQLTIMVGGDADVFARAEPVMASYAKAVTHMGMAGSGQLTKMVNQICIAGLVQALAEALAFAQKAGLDGNRVLDVITKGAAGSWQMENRGRTMLEGKFDFGFAVDWMRKDLAICRAEAARNGARLPVTEVVDAFYAAVQNKGGNRWDTSSLIELLR
ncbi:MAG: NAD(P)-dependent oxidoreductase [Verrucomicrobia bacterium]|nr:NAD(P)-dependent oxidoreductase [Verrucomicrobiota bacterium]